MTEFFVFMLPSWYNTRKQLIKGHFFEGLKNYMGNKSEGKKKKKKILGYFHRTIDKMDRDGRNKTQRLCRYGSNYALSKLIVYNGLDDLWGRDNPDSCEFTNYDGSSGTKSRIFRVYTNKKIAKNTKINQIKVSFTDHYNAISLDRLP